MEGIDKLSRITPYILCMIVTLNDSGLNTDTLIREDNMQISRPRISLFLKRYNATIKIEEIVQTLGRNLQMSICESFLMCCH
jgi:hypothetical protein